MDEFINEKLIFENCINLLDLMSENKAISIFFNNPSADVHKIQLLY